MVKAKKHFGQHFLKDQSIAERIADALQFRASVLEVGPGTGILSKALLKVAENFQAVEIDRESIDYLLQSQTLQGHQLLEHDFLRLDIKALFSEQFSVVGNFPYYISSQIVFKVLENYEQIPEMLGMFQKELAERICAGPGSKVYGAISVFVASRYDAEYLFTLNEDEFYPPPKVKSAVIRLRRKASPLDEAAYQGLSKVLKPAFGQRRKTMRNSLKVLADQLELPEEYSGKRPEQCSLEDFIFLSNQLNLKQKS